MINIRRIEPHEVPFAKELIYRVAHQVFQDTRPLEEAIAFYESQQCRCVIWMMFSRPISITMGFSS